MSTVLDLTLTALAQGIADTLPARWDFELSPPAPGSPVCPDDAVNLTWQVGPYLLGVALDQPAAALLIAQENAVDTALSAPVAAAATVLGELTGDDLGEIGAATLVDNLDAALSAADGETRWIQLTDADEHRATIAVRLVVTDEMLRDAGGDAPPTSPGDLAGQPIAQAAQGAVAIQGSIGQQAGIMSGQSQGTGQPQGTAPGDRFDSPIVPGVNPNDMPSSLGRTPGDVPMMPPNAVAHPAEFTAFDDYGQLGGTPHPMALLSDVELGVTAELGRTRLTVKDVLSLTPGSIIELDRSAGAPVDVVVNGTLIARGEVVVIDEEFGVRITQIMGMPDLAKANALELANDG